jgi:3-oxoadipate CoA-transferase, alpha subunit
MAINKVFQNFNEAVADIFAGAVILIGGFGPANGCPSNLIRSLAKKNVGDLTLVGNTPGHGRELFDSLQTKGMLRVPANYDDGALLVKNGQVKKVICSFPGSPWPGTENPTQDCFARGKLEIELVPQGTLAERIRAAKAGISAFYTPAGVDTLLENGKETRLFDGVANILEHAIKADFALIRAHKADRWGNLVYQGTSRNFNATMAGAAKITIAEVDQIVETAYRFNSQICYNPGIFAGGGIPRCTKRSFYGQLNTQVYGGLGECWC